MTARRRIAVVTATRAEYGLLSVLLGELRDAPEVELQLIVTGAHLSPLHGHTVDQIVADGFEIAAAIPIPLDDDRPAAITRSLGLATIGFADALERLAPEVLVLLGDRWELLAAAEAALIARIPVAHIHGGETTEGAMDDSIRHALTKLSHLHFVSAEAYRDRVVQLGEGPDRVFVVGAMGLDLVAGLTLPDRAALEASIGHRFGSPSFLVTFHPETLGDDDRGRDMATLLDVLAETGGSVLLTGVNADPGSSVLREVAERRVALHPDRFTMVTSLGSLRYLGAMAVVDVVVGNSSSGLLEAPALGTPTVDIGNRQKGRLAAPSVVHCGTSAEEIRAAIAHALSPEHRAIAAEKVTPYGGPGAARKVAAVLRERRLDDLLVKPFHDLPR